MLLQRNIVLTMEGRGKAVLCKPDKTKGKISRSASTPGQAVACRGQRPCRHRGC